MLTRRLQRQVAALVLGVLPLAFFACAAGKTIETTGGGPLGGGGSSSSTASQVGGAGAGGSTSNSTGALVLTTGSGGDPNDGGLDPDAACAATSEKAKVEKLPVDIIWVVDSSSSMQVAIDQVTAGLNDFAALIGSRSLDYKVIMLALRSKTNPVTINGSKRYGVCIPPPLAGDTDCGNGPNFFQSSIDIKSTQPLEQFLGTLGQTAGYRPGEDRGGEAWAQELRPQATKTIVIVTDDDSRLSGTDFQHFAGGTDPFNSTTLPPGILDPSYNGLFTDFTFSGLYGWGAEMDPSVRCQFPDSTFPAASGATYTTLVTTTHGVRAKICSGAPAWAPFFDAVAAAVEKTAKLKCELPIPNVPDGGTLNPSRINVSIVSTSDSTALAKVADASACGADGGWYYDDDQNPSEVFLCPVSCDLAQEQAEQHGAEIDILFGCKTIVHPPA